MRQEGVSVRVARIFNTFGPRMHMNDGRVVSNFILQALQNESITIYGSGKQTRSFQYVSDLVDGLVALMASNYTLPVNIGNPVEHTIESENLLSFTHCVHCTGHMLSRATYVSYTVSRQLSPSLFLLKV